MQTLQLTMVTVFILDRNSPIEFCHVKMTICMVEVSPEKAISIKEDTWTQYFEWKIKKNSEIFYPNAQLFTLMDYFSKGKVILKEEKRHSDAGRFFTIASCLAPELQIKLSTILIGAAYTLPPPYYTSAALEEAQTDPLLRLEPHSITTQDPF